MEDEVRESMYLAVGLIILAVVLTFFTYSMGLERKMANIRNSEITASRLSSQYREFSAYNGKNIIGDDAIELIRLKYDSGITIFVGYRKNVKDNKEVSSSSRMGTGNLYSAAGVDARYFNADNYILCQQVAQYGGASFFAINQNAKDADTNDMRNWFPTTARYRAYLVYDSEDVEAFYNGIHNYLNLHGAGASTLEAKCDIMDQYAMAKKRSGSEVTGIVLIYIDNSNNIKW